MSALSSIHVLLADDNPNMRAIVAAMLALCFAGMRFAFAGALVGTAGLVWLIGWDAGIRTAGIAPYTSGSNYTLSVLPMFILIGYLAYYAGVRDAIATGAPLPASGEDALQVMQVIEAGLRSDAERREVPLHP